MKKRILLASFIFLAGSLIFAENELPHQSVYTILKQSYQPNELIVSFEKLSLKQYQDLDLALSTVNGIRKIGSCERMNIFYFTYDETIFRTAEEAFDALIVATKVYQPLMKIGASSGDVERECNK